MPASHRYNAGMKYGRTQHPHHRTKNGAAKAVGVRRQYTIRKVPMGVDAALRKAAREHGKSINQTALDALAAGLRLGNQQPQHNDLDFMAGTWKDDPDFDAAIKAQDHVDRATWRS
ncbi:MAG: hypothetical protein HKL95_06340 [Phycisphaerae bacterium]|nr:hypothetical protein [Phycisphaerae bacterium]